MLFESEIMSVISTYKCIINLLHNPGLFFYSFIVGLFQRPDGGKYIINPQHDSCGLSLYKTCK